MILRAEDHRYAGMMAPGGNVRHRRCLGFIAVVLVTAAVCGTASLSSHLSAQQNEAVSIRQLPGSNADVSKIRNLRKPPRRLNMRQLSRDGVRSQARIRQVRRRAPRRSLSYDGWPELRGRWPAAGTPPCNADFTGRRAPVTSIACRLRALHVVRPVRTGVTEQALIEGLIKDLIISSGGGRGVANGASGDGVLRLLLGDAQGVDLAGSVALEIFLHLNTGGPDITLSREGVLEALE